MCQTSALSSKNRLFSPLAALACLLLAAATPIWSLPAQAGEVEAKALLDAKVAKLKDTHENRAKVLIKLAEDEKLRSFMAGNRGIRGALTKFANELQKDAIGREFCLIERSGKELMRLVDGKPSPDSELSDDEDDSPFFRPTFQRHPGEIYIAPVYLSPDANEWVLAYTTPVAGKDAFLHYEFPLKDYRAFLVDGLSGDDRFLLVADHSGFALMDSRAALDTQRKKGKSAMRDYFKQIDFQFDKLRSEGTPEIRDHLRRMLDGEAGQGTITFKGGEKFGLAYRSVDDWVLAIFDRVK
jgi:hypothetical protein